MFNCSLIILTYKNKEVIMNLLQKIDSWAYRHHPKWLDVLRILLGVIIFMKGYFFIKNTDMLMSIMTNSKFPWVSLILAHYVAFAHLVGGFMIAIGLLTRLVVIFQLPVLIGAVIFVNAQHGFFSENSELMFSIIVLFLLIFFLIYGSGPMSIDESWNKNEKPDENRT